MSSKTQMCFFLSQLKVGLVYPFNHNCIRGVMVSVLASSAVNRGFQPVSGQAKEYEIGICYFSAKHVALRRKSNNRCPWHLITGC